MCQKRSEGSSGQIRMLSTPATAMDKLSADPPALFDHNRPMLRHGHDPDTCPARFWMCRNPSDMDPLPLPLQGHQYSRAPGGYPQLMIGPLSQRKVPRQFCTCIMPPLAHPNVSPGMHFARLVCSTRSTELQDCIAKPCPRVRSSKGKIHQQCFYRQAPIFSNILYASVIAQREQQQENSRLRPFLLTLFFLSLHWIPSSLSLVSLRQLLRDPLNGDT